MTSTMSAGKQEVLAVLRQLAGPFGRAAGTGTLDRLRWSSQMYERKNQNLERKVASLVTRFARPEAPYQDREVAAGWLRHHELVKFNPNHDERGRFDFGSGGGSSGSTNGGAKVSTLDRLTANITHSDGHTEVRTGGSQSWRNNNPGNIRYGPFARSQGAIGSANGFAVFASEQEGQNALNVLMSGSTYSAMTINAAIEKYAPSNENDSVSHAANITRISGLSGNRTIGDLTHEEFLRLTDAIKIAEGFKPGTISKH